MNRLMADFLALEAAKQPFYHIHGAGKQGCPLMLEALGEKGVDLGACPALQLREYIYDMAPVMRAADLVICRAGASTISELTALGTPALMVPSPYVTNNHQEKNARALEEAGGAMPAAGLEEKARTAGYTFASIKRAKKELKAEGTIKHFQTGSAKSGDKTWHMQLVNPDGFVEVQEDEPTPFDGPVPV